MKTLLLLFPALLAAQTVQNVNVNIQVLSNTVIQAKYRVKMPKGIWGASAVAENLSGGTMYIGQGSVIKALRDKGYPALSASDASAVLLHAQIHTVFGWISNNLPFVNKMLNDTTATIVATGVKLTPGVGLGVALAAGLLNSLTPDIITQIQTFEQAYASDGLQNILMLGPGASQVATVIFDSPPRFSETAGTSFQISVPVVAVTGQQPAFGVSCSACAPGFQPVLTPGK